jgi:2-methylcitrate dehydratase
MLQTMAPFSAEAIVMKKREREVQACKQSDSRNSSIGRRDLMKISAAAGVGLVLGQLPGLESAAAAATPAISAVPGISALPQALTTDGQPTELPPWGSLPNPTGVTHRVSKAGFKLSGNRAFGMAPFDDITKQVLDYATQFWNSPLPDEVALATSELMVDSMGCIIAGFDSDPVRASARVSSQCAGTSLKSTVMGYGISSTVEMATHTNCCMVRHNDWSDNGLSGTHFSDSIPGIVAVAEAFHLSGEDVLKAVTLAFELIGAFQSVPGSQGRAWDTIYVGPSACIGIGKMLKMNDDQLANAYSLSLTTHWENNTSHSSGPLSMMKACHNADTVRGAVNSILLAREGMTGPPAPFAGTKGVFDAISNGPFKLVLPCPQNERNPFFRPGQMVVQGIEVKRFAAEGNAQAMLVNIPELKKFMGKPEDVAAIDVEMTSFGEIGDPAKWDPHNEETADHSVPYMIARGLLDGDIFLSSYTRAKFTDPAARALMDKTTIREVPGMTGSPRITIRKTSGETLSKDAPVKKKMTHEEVVAKFNRICDYKKVNPAQRDRVREQWLNLKGEKDMATVVAGVAKFGQPRPLSDRTPTN